MSDSENSRKTSFSDSRSHSQSSHTNPFAHYPPDFPVQPEPSYNSASSNESTQNTRVIELQDRNMELQYSLREAQRDAQRLSGSLALRDGQLEMARALIATLKDRIRENDDALANAKQLLLQAEGSGAKKDKLLLFAKEEQAKSRENQAKAAAVIRSLIQIIVVVCWIAFTSLLAYLLK